MSVIDARGRLFGAINVIDAVVAAAVIAGVAWFASPSRDAPDAGDPQITTVTPKTVVAGQRTRVRIGGVGFRPGLRAFFSKAGQPFMVGELDGSQEAKYFLSTSELVEVETPELVPGVYDFYLFDGPRQAAARSAVLRVERATLPLGSIDLKLRFFLPPESARMIQVGDQDQVLDQRPTSPAVEGAIVRRVDVNPTITDILEMHLVDADMQWFGEKMGKQPVDVLLQVPLLMHPDGARGYGDRSLRVGDVFTLTTDRYRFHGVIASAGAVTTMPADAPPVRQ